MNLQLFKDLIDANFNEFTIHFKIFLCLLHFYDKLEFKVYMILPQTACPALPPKQAEPSLFTL